MIIRESAHSGEETLPTFSDTSPPRPWTLPSKDRSRACSPSPRTLPPPPSSRLTSLPVVSLVPSRSLSSTPSITPVLDLPTTPKVNFIKKTTKAVLETFRIFFKKSNSPIQARTANDSTTVWSMFTERPSLLMVSLVSTEDSPSLALVSLSTEVSTLVSTILLSLCSLVTNPASSFPSFSDGVSSLLNWILSKFYFRFFHILTLSFSAVTVVSGLASYPIDTVRRRMMMTSGTGVHYKSSLDCGMQVIRNEGFMSLMKGAGANVLRGIAGAGVLSGFDLVKDAYVAMRTA